MINIPMHSTSEILVTRNCNLNCKYCFEKNKNKSNSNPDLFIKYLTNDDLFYNMLNDGFYMFGGEPMMNIDFVVKAIEKIEASENLSSFKKRDYIKTIVENFTTNGTLIEKYIDILKKYNFTLQVSLDGPEDINDACRVDYNGKGHYPQIMQNLELLRENGVPYVIHGAISHTNFKNFCRINEWFIEQEQMRYVNQKAPISEFLTNNYCQLVVEEEISDQDIDDLLDQTYKTVKMVLETPLLNDYTDEERRQCAANFLNKQHGSCAAGNSMFTLDENFKVYSCHRLVTDGLPQISDCSFTTIDGTDRTPNYEFYEQYLDVINKGKMYSALYKLDNFSSNTKYQCSWCPNTNIEKTGSIYVLPSRYSVMIAELQSFVPEVANYFNLDLSTAKK